MSAQERLRAAWAAWAPSIRHGRFEVGNILVMSRTELSRTARTMYDSGVRAERRWPGSAPLMCADDEVAEVRHLRSV